MSLVEYILTSTVKTKVLLESGKPSFLADMEKLPSGGSAEFEDYEGNIVELADLNADNPGGGWGTEAMNFITKSASKHGVDLLVLPVGEPGDEAHDRLAKFYERFGFYDTGEGAYHRDA